MIKHRVFNFATVATSSFLLFLKTHLNLNFLQPSRSNVSILHFTFTI